jgi:PleD family two-component response regulator
MGCNILFANNKKEARQANNDRGAEHHTESSALLYKPATPLNLDRAMSNAIPEQKPIDLKHQRTALSSDDNALQPFAGTAILLVDDNEINRKIAQGIINNLGLECVTAENGSDALSKLESYPKGGDFNYFGAVLMVC